MFLFSLNSYSQETIKRESKGNKAMFVIGGASLFVGSLVYFAKTQLKEQPIGSPFYRDYDNTRKNYDKATSILYTLSGAFLTIGFAIKF